MGKQGETEGEQSFLAGRTEPGVRKRRRPIGHVDWGLCGAGNAGTGKVDKGR